MKGKLKNLSWTILDSIFNNGFSFLVGIILARNLSPEIFGSIGIILMILSFLKIFIDGGLNFAILQSTKITEGEYSTVFYSQIILSVLFFILLNLYSKNILGLIGHIELVNETRILSLILLIDPLYAVHKIKMSLNFRFEEVAKISILSSLLSGLVSIILVFNDFGIYSIIVQQIVKSIALFILYFIKIDGFPRWYVDLEYLSRISKKSMKIIVSSLITNLNSKAMYIFMSKQFSLANLGYYSRSEQFESILSGSFTGAVDKVNFSSLHLAKRNNCFEVSFKKSLTRTVLIHVLIFSLLYAFSYDLIYMLFGQKWIPSVPILRLLILGTLFYPLDLMGHNTLTIYGFSGAILLNQISKTVLIIIQLIVGYFFGFEKMLITRIICNSFSSFFIIYLAQRAAKLSLLKHIASQAKLYVLSFFTTIVLFLVDSLVDDYSFGLLVKMLTSVVVLILIRLGNFDSDYSKIFDYFISYTKMLIIRVNNFKKTI